MGSVAVTGYGPSNAALNALGAGAVLELTAALLLALTGLSVDRRSAGLGLEQTPAEAKKTAKHGRDLIPVCAAADRSGEYEECSGSISARHCGPRS
jgi:hypothetical protein